MRKQHKNTGLSDGRLHRCPDLYNCVVSMHPDDARHHLAPWPYDVDRSRAISVLRKILQDDKLATLQKDSGDYLHATFKTAFFNFTDDVEFYFPKDEKLVHFRSASRIGTWDFGANKRRMKKLKKRFLEKSGG